VTGRIVAYNLPLNLDFYGYQGLAASHPMEWMTEFSTQLWTPRRSAYGRWRPS
jgi:hypothetical protein